VVPYFSRQPAQKETLEEKSWQLTWQQQRQHGVQQLAGPQVAKTMVIYNLEDQLPLARLVPPQQPLLQPLGEGGVVSPGGAQDIPDGAQYDRRQRHQQMISF